MRIVGAALIAVVVLAGASACKSATTADSTSGGPTSGGPRTGGSASSAPAVPGGSAAPGPVVSDPCRLVTAGEIKAATGIAYPKGTPAIGEVAYCKYVQGSNYLVVEAYPSGDAGVYERAIQGAASVSGGTVAKVSGVGDAAGYVARAATLCVHQGTRNLCVVGPGEKADLSLARRALPRLGAAGA